MEILYKTFLLLASLSAAGLVADAIFNKVGFKRVAQLVLAVSIGIFLFFFSAWVFSRTGQIFEIPSGLVVL